MRFPFIGLPTKHPKYIQRPTEIHPEELPKVAAAAAGAGGGPEQKLMQNEITQDREERLTRSNTWQGHFFRYRPPAPAACSPWGANPPSQPMAVI